TRGGQIEVLLLRENATNDWWVMLRPGRRARTGTKITFANIHAQARNILGWVVEQNDEGHRRLLFTGTTDIGKELQSFGEVPLPPYIERTARNNLAEDEERYQTIYASVEGSVAATTAGLLFMDAGLKAYAR